MEERAWRAACGRSLRRASPGGAAAQAGGSTRGPALGRGCSRHLAPPGCAWAALPVAFEAEVALVLRRWLWFFRAEDFSFSLVIMCDFSIRVWSARSC